MKTWYMGGLTASALSALAGMYMPGRYSLIHSIEVSFLKPVFIADCPLKVCGQVEDKDERFRFITLKFTMINTKEEKVCKGKMKIGVME